MSTYTKTALVTGGNRGIGLAIVQGLAQKGIRVLLACRDQQQGLQAARAIHGAVEVVELDLADTSTMKSQIEMISNNYPDIDILINNAGLLTESDFKELSHSALMESLQVNALSVFVLIQFFAPKMATRGAGRIVNLSSDWGAFSEGLTGPAAYSISKATLNAITVVASQQYPETVKINAMCPGWVQTRMGGAGATLTPEQGAETAIWLATSTDGISTGGFYRQQSRIDW